MNMKQKPILRNILSVFMIMLGTWSLQATHIVGGEMNYTCLGNNNFEIQLTVFRDCFYADPRAFFDDPAYIGVFNSNNQRVRQLAFPLLTNDTIPAILSDSCLFVPNDVCVHTTTYRGIVNLPLIEGGYQLAYERCCRNETIMNILDPLNAGAVYNVFISEESLTECNNSAKFKDWPPIFVCVNEPIDWDHSAIDVDGDSLVYALCTPLSGGTQADPKPVPTNNPPFDQVVWNEPAFGLDNLLGGTPLAIDPQTGQLTGMPTVMGQFVVGVNVKEFRNGEMISVTRRDFQYNVGECGEVEAAIVAPQVQCEDLSVSFTNTSLNADAYLWSFNDPNNPGAFSTTEEPTFVYADTGTYTIRLISSTKTVCRDTSYHTVFLQRNSMKADFEVDVLDCLDNSTLNVSDLSIDSVSAPAFWDWQLKVDGELAATSNIQNPVFNIEAPASVELTLSVTSENGCVDGTTKSFSADLNDPGDDIESEILVCIGTETQLNPDYNPDLTYQWQLNPLFDDLSSPNPTVIANEDIDLQVIIRDENNACSISKTVQIRVAEIPAINAIPDQFILCEGESAQLNATEYPNLVFEWSGNGLDDPSSDTPIATPSETTTYTVNITDINQNNCGLSKQVEVVVNPNPDDVLASISNDAIICPGENLALNPSDAPNFDYNWFG
ncbi:MAG: hypothetical protein KJP00_00200, partial [Bacteroidia bacterium]|nr:hypothetical protein [Bacteroidia bacterium]